MQAKRNVESGRVFEAHEAAAAAQQALAEREAQASQAAEALHAERCERAALAASLDSVAMDRDSLAREVGELRVRQRLGDWGLEGWACSRPTT